MGPRTLVRQTTAMAVDSLRQVVDDQKQWLKLQKKWVKQLENEYLLVNIVGKGTRLGVYGARSVYSMATSVVQLQISVTKGSFSIFIKVCTSDPVLKGVRTIKLSITSFTKASLNAFYAMAYQLYVGVVEFVPVVTHIWKKSTIKCLEYGHRGVDYVIDRSIHVNRQFVFPAIYYSCETSYKCAKVVARESGKQIKNAYSKTVRKVMRLLAKIMVYSQSTITSISATTVKHLTTAQQSSSKYSFKPQKTLLLQL